MRNNNVLTWIILILLGIGVLTTLIASPSKVIIPLIVFGTIYYFLKHPEKLNKLTKRKYHNNNYKTKHYNKRKDITFKVINGKKDDDDRPKYH